MKNSIRISFFFLTCFLTCLTVKAQFPNPANFNTATNSTNTGTLPVGSSDLNWSAALTSSLGPYVPAVSCGNVAPCCWINSPFANANWISYPHTCNPFDPADHSCLAGNQDIYYKLSFNLPASTCGQAITTASAYCLSFDFYSDNCVYEIFVNGVQNYLSPSANSYYYMGYNSQGGVTKSLCNNWQAGANNVIVHLRSGQNPAPTWEGLLAQANQTLNTTVGQPYLNATIIHTNVSCFGGSNGIASVSVSGSSSPSYSWMPTGGTGNIATGLSAGNYSVVVTSGSCSVTQTVSITQPIAFAITASPNTTLCNGVSSVLSASGAVSYSWNTGSTNSSVSINAPGTYTVTGFNSAGCSNSKTISVTAGSAPVLSVSGPSAICIGSPANYMASGANSYTWSTGATSNSISVSPPSSTVYTVTGTSPGLACASTSTVALTVNNFLTLSISGPTAVCSGSSAILTVSGANTYTWNNGVSSSTLNVSPTLNTTYSVSGTNTITGCFGSISMAVGVNPLPSISVNNVSVCAGAVTIATASGATSYTWSNGALTPTSTLSSGGIYSVTGISSAGCAATQTMNVTVLNLPVITISGTQNICAGQPATLAANGADSYTWNTGSNSPVLSLNNVSAGNIYTVSGTNNTTGCSNLQTFTLTVYPLPTVSVSGNTVSCSGVPVVLTAVGAATYSWNNGATGSSISVTPSNSAVYNVTGTDNNGCKSVAAYTVLAGTTPIVSAPNATTCAGQPVALSASGASSYLWNTGETINSVTVSPFTQTTYTVTGFASLSLCNSIHVLTVSVMPSPQLSVNYNLIGICQGESAMLVVSGGNNYTWSNGVTNDSLFVTPNITTIYTVISAQGSNSCVSSKTIMVNVYGLPPVKIIGDTLLCDGESTTLRALGASAYQWSTGSTKDQLDITINQNAVYVLVGTDAETGCKNSDSMRVGNSEKCCDIFIPNSFTPNEDNMNEDFGPVTLCEFVEYKMYIFDKWGEQIFVSNNVSARWNGYYKGVLSKEDVYVYLIRAKRKGIGLKTYEKTGHVSLIK